MPQAVTALLDLRARLPAEIAIWAGGGCTALRSQRLSGIRVMQRLADIVDARSVAQWRTDGGREAQLTAIFEGDSRTVSGYVRYPSPFCRNEALRRRFKSGIRRLRSA